MKINFQTAKLNGISWDTRDTVNEFNNGLSFVLYLISM